MKARVIGGPGNEQVVPVTGRLMRMPLPSRAVFPRESVSPSEIVFPVAEYRLERLEDGELVYMHYA